MVRKENQKKVFKIFCGDISFFPVFTLELCMSLSEAPSPVILGNCCKSAFISSLPVLFLKST